MEWSIHYLKSGIVKKIPVIISTCVLFLSNLNAFDLISQIHTDYLVYQAEKAGYSTFEFYVSFTNSDIQFVADGDAFRAGIEAGVVLKDLDGNVIDEQYKRQTIKSKSFRQTLSGTVVNVFKFTFVERPGNYRIFLSLQDIESGQEKRDNLPIALADFSTAPMALSSLKLSTSKSDVLQQSLPNIDHVFTFRNSRVFLYYEGYYNSSDKKNEIRTTYEILKPNGKKLNAFHEKLCPTARRQGYYLNFSVASLPPDEYILRVTQQNLLNGNSASVSTNFRVLQSPLDLSFKTWDQALDEIHLIATDKEMDYLKNVPPERQQSELETFWKNRDPIPQTECNELMLEYYHRIEIANQVFSSVANKGEKSDPGLIYILFGTPDLIVNFPPTNYSMARQVWKYKKLGVRFTFEAPNNRSALFLRDRAYVYARYIHN